MDLTIAVDSLWILLCAILVIFMQVGFVFLEAGSVRMKNSGHIAAKQLLSFSIAAIAFWAFGYGLTYGSGTWIGTDGWFLSFDDEGGVPIEISYLFQFAFVAVSLAIAWGGFAERAKASVYITFGILFTVLIYPVVGHSVWSEEGWLHVLGKQDFAGSTVVHLTGGVAALVATILLKPRIGRFNEDGSPNSLPGHNLVYSVIGALIIWIGWFGFNPGSTLTIQDGFFGYVALTTNLAAGAGALAAWLAARFLSRKVEVPIIVNGVLAGLVAITAACAFVEPWAAIVIGLVAGSVAIFTARWLEKLGIDDPIHAVSVHGVAGILGTISTGFFAAPHLVEQVGIGSPGLLYGGGWNQFWVQIVGVGATILYVTIATAVVLIVIQTITGLRVSENEELVGLDVTEHGGYGYPEHIHTSKLHEKQPQP